MPVESRKLKSALFALALFAALPACEAGTPPTADPSVASANTLIQAMAHGHFNKAEARFAAQMKQDAPPQKLRQLWDSLVRHGGAFQKTGATRTIHKEGHTIVIVRTDFKRRPIGLMVAFDTAHRIVGVHLAPPPGERF